MFVGWLFFCLYFDDHVWVYFGDGGVEYLLLELGVAFGDGYHLVVEGLFFVVFAAELVVALH